MLDNGSTWNHYCCVLSVDWPSSLDFAGMSFPWCVYLDNNDAEASAAFSEYMTAWDSC